ncbi:unnamed protein product [Eruca vesicaria subsp. sativa]|uniref:Uncharacterized protein n=1 Tax=Eruca vesicaria subsp. sativa TaxID=29727 RepID=A0ABC8K6X2_ERUVS|nr:unnamed protein product [Eruca vesicaria subsp. sativa]
MDFKKPITRGIHRIVHIRYEGSREINHTSTADLIVTGSTSSWIPRMLFPPPSFCNSFVSLIHLRSEHAATYHNITAKERLNMQRIVQKLDMLWHFNQDQDLQLLRESKLRHEMSEREATSGEQDSKHPRLMVFHGTWRKILLRKCYKL